jgi:predicted LPLAT superfamily acyltransferase
VTPSWDGTTKGSLWGYRFFIRTVKLFGVSVAYGFAAFIVVYYIIFVPRSSRAIHSYFRQRHHFGKWKAITMTYRNFYRFAQILIDKIAIPAKLAKGFTYRFGDGYTDLLRLLDGSTGCILMSAHVGNWDIAGEFFGSYGPRLHIVMLDAEHRRTKRLLDATTGNKHYKVIALRDDMSHVFEIGTALVNNEYVCFQGDRYLPGAPTLTRSLLGAPARFPDGPFQTAARSHAPVVFFFAMREHGRRYRFCFHPAQIDLSLSKKDLSGSLATQYVQALEKILHRYPEQWFNYYDFWENIN